MNRRYSQGLLLYQQTSPRYYDTLLNVGANQEKHKMLFLHAHLLFYPKKIFALQFFTFKDL